MYIIEFNGLPGCGKSTLCDEIISDFNEKNIISLRDVINYNSSNSTKNFINLMKILFNYKLILFNLAVLKFSLSYGFDFNRLIFAARLIKLNGNLYYYSKKNPNLIAILDEGYIQYITSIPHTIELNISDDLKKMIKYIRSKHSFKFIHCEIDEETNYLRLFNRDNVARRFDSLSESELSETLMMKYRNIHTIRFLIDKEKDGVQIDTSKTIDTNVRYINNILGLMK